MNLKYPVLFTLCFFALSLHARGHLSKNDKPLIIEASSSYTHDTERGSISINIIGGKGKLDIKIVNSNGADIIERKRNFTIDNLKLGYYIVVVTDEGTNMAMKHIKLGIE